MRACNQAKVLQRFQKGDVNALFSTSVAEEGLDVQVRWCLVHRFLVYRSDNCIVDVSAGSVFELRDHALRPLSLLWVLFCPM